MPGTIGVGIFVAGLLADQVNWKSALLSIGGTLFGSSLGTALGLIAGDKLQKQVVEVQQGVDGLLKSIRQDSSELYQQVSNTLSKAIQFPWATEESVLKSRRIRHHLYYRTRMGGEEFWMYLPLDFSQQFLPGRLHCTVTIPMEGSSYDYHYDGLLIGQTLAIIVKSMHGEKEGIITIRDYGIGLGVQGYWGLYSHMDWDARDGFDPCILASNQFEGAGSLGRQTPEFARFLETKWLRLAPESGQRIIDIPPEL